MSIDANSSIDNLSSENKIDLDAVYELVRKDSILPESIQILGKLPALPPSQVRNILLTGATGRFGSYILKDLMLNPLLNVICLIRGKTVENARKKLAASLKKFNILNNVNLNNVKIVVGNICENLLGIAPEEYESLSKEVHLVLHLAAKANHIEQISKYRVSKNSSDIRSVNVLGTLNVIKFASNIRTKRIVFASTFATVNRLTDKGFASEDFPEDDNKGEGITMGYILSKFVCEKLLKEAVDRGIPCTVIRYPTLIGDSLTGHFSVDTDTFLNFILMSCKMGCIPDLNGGWYTCPVDVASQLSLEILFNDNAPVGVFNLLQTTAICPPDCIDTAVRLGYEMKIVPEQQYAQKLQEESKSSTWISVFTDAYGSNFISNLYSSNTMSSLAIKNKKSIYKFSDKFLKVIPNVQERIPSLQNILHLYIDFANKSGISEKFGINAPSSS
jgi:thioester reductase-like protein